MRNIPSIQPANSTGWNKICQVKSRKKAFHGEKKSEKWGKSEINADFCQGPKEEHPLYTDEEKTSKNLELEKWKYERTSVESQ